MKGRVIMIIGSCKECQNPMSVSGCDNGHGVDSSDASALLVAWGTTKLLNEAPDMYVGAINMAARGHATMRDEGSSYEQLSGARAIVRLLIGCYLELGASRGRELTAVTCNVIDYWVGWQRIHGHK